MPIAPYASTPVPRLPQQINVTRADPRCRGRCGGRATTRRASHRGRSPHGARQDRRSRKLGGRYAPAEAGRARATRLAARCAGAAGGDSWTRHRSPRQGREPLPWREDIPVIVVSPRTEEREARLAVEDEHELLLGKVIVVRVGRFARRQLPQAQPQPLAASLSAETGAQAAKTGVLAWLVEDEVVDVGHRAEGICGLLVPGLRTVQMK